MMTMSEHDLSDLTSAVNAANLGAAVTMATAAGSAKDILWQQLVRAGWLVAITDVCIERTNLFKVHQTGVTPLRRLTSELYSRRQQQILTEINENLQMQSPRERRFKLLVPSNSSYLGISGKVGSTPDTGILTGSRQGCARNCLPRYINDLTFTVARPEGSREQLQNFYLVEESPGYFFILSSILADFLRQQFDPSDIQIAPVQLRHSNGAAVEERYFAVKILKTVDCIDPENSFGRRIPWGDDRLPFTECTVSYDLEQSVAADFANVGKEQYVSYPDSTEQVFNVRLRESNIALGDRLFYPALWPGFLIVEESFGQALAQLCFGGTPGYYFWMLDLENVCEGHRQLRIALR